MTWSVSFGDFGSLPNPVFVAAGAPRFPYELGHIVAGLCCTSRYGVSFALSAKILVNGADAHPLYRFLTHAAPGLLGSEAIKWNFTKFLVDRQGRGTRRYASTTTPAEPAGDIEALLG